MWGKSGFALRGKGSRLASLDVRSDEFCVDVVLVVDDGSGSGCCLRVCVCTCVRVLRSRKNQEKGRAVASVLSFTVL